MIQFRTLGVLDLRGPGGEFRSILSQPKRLALFAWLAIERPRGFQSRDRARVMFWPEQDDVHARGALNRAIYWLRQSLGDGVLVSRGDEAIGVAADSCWTDVEAFESASADGRHAEAVELYRGDLLPGFFVSGAAGFERWLEAERQRLRNLAHRAGQALTEAAVAEGNLTPAAQWARWTLERSPCDEPSVRRLMSILDAAGDRAGAAQAYEQFARHIAAELDLAPSPETQALLGSLRARTGVAAADAGTAASAGIVRNDGLAGGSDAAPRPCGTGDDAIFITAPYAAEAHRSRGHQDLVTPLTMAGQGASPANDPAGAPARRQRPRARIVIASASALVVLAVVGLVLQSSGQRGIDPRRVVVHPFENRTGDPAFDHLAQLTSHWITRGLVEAGIAGTVSLPPASGRARRASLPGAWINPRRMGEGTRPGIDIRGAIYRSGGLLRFEGTVIGAPPRRMAWTLSSVTAPVDSPEQAMREIRDRATGASAALLNPRFASWLPLGTTTPPTFDAFKEFVRGDELILSRRARDALPYLRSATALDTTFTWARLQIASAYLNVLDTEGADSIAASLNRMHQRLTPLELSWLAWMDALIEENEVEANRAMARAADLAPDRFLDLHAETLRWLNRPVEIVKLLRHAGPGSPYHSGGAPYWGRLADSYHQLGQHRRELAVTAHMRRYQPADVQALWLEIRALAALGRTKEVTTRLEFAEALPRETPLSPGSLMRQAAEELRAHGHPQAAAAVLDRIIVWYDGLPREDAGKVNNRFEVARALYLVGRLDAAESLFEQLAIDDPDSLAEYDGALGVIAARRGDRATAERFLAALERQRLAIDPPPRYAMYAQARIVALLGDPDRAVRMLREALGGQGRDLHMDADFEPLARDPGFKGFIRPKG